MCGMEGDERGGTERSIYCKTLFYLQLVTSQIPLPLCLSPPWTKAWIKSFLSVSVLFLDRQWEHTASETYKGSAVHWGENHFASVSVLVRNHIKTIQTSSLLPKGNFPSVKSYGAHFFL